MCAVQFGSAWPESFAALGCVVPALGCVVGGCVVCARGPRCVVDAADWSCPGARCSSKAWADYIRAAGVVSVLWGEGVELQGSVWWGLLVCAVCAAGVPGVSSMQPDRHA